MSVRLADRLADTLMRRMYFRWCHVRHAMQTHACTLQPSTTLRLLSALAALCSLAIVVAEATIAGVLPNMSVVSAALHATAGGLLCV